MKNIIPLILFMLVINLPGVHAQKGTKLKAESQQLLKNFFQAAKAGDSDEMAKFLVPLNWGTRDSLPWLKLPDLLKPLASSHSEADLNVMSRFSKLPEVPSWIRDSMFVVGFPLKDLESQDKFLPQNASIFLGPLIGTIVPGTPIPNGLEIHVTATYSSSDNSKTTFPYNRIMFETFMQLATRAAKKGKQMVFIPIRRTPDGLLIYVGNGLMY